MGGHCQKSTKRHEKFFRVLLFQEKKKYKFWIYYSLDEMTHKILCLKRIREKYRQHIIFVKKVGSIILGGMTNLCEAQ